MNHSLFLVLILWFLALIVSFCSDASIAKRNDNEGLPNHTIGGGSRANNSNKGNGEND